MTTEACAEPIPVQVPPRGGSGLGVQRPTRRLGARILSLLGLAGVLWGLAQGGLVAYHLLRDSFVAPLILSKDSDVAIQSKLSLSRLLAERHAMTVRMQTDRDALKAAEEAIGRLEEVKASTATALEWSVAITTRQTTIGARDLQALEEQQRMLIEMISEQESLVSELQDHLSAGMIHKSDVAREELALKQLRVGALANERDRLANELERGAAQLMQRSLERPKANGIPVTPEVLAHRDQLVKLDLELLKLRAEARAKRLQGEADAVQLAGLDELVAEIKMRPIFRALDSSQNVAFVPYTQLEGVVAGASVLYCKWWGLFRCRLAGRVSEVVPGEVLAEDPWGTPMRGQYAILELDDPRAAQSRSLRIRAPHGMPRASDPWL